MAIAEKVRLDGRKTTDIRNIWSEVAYLPSAHGSAIFTRGETQSLTTVTLGTPKDGLIIDGAFHQGEDGPDHDDRRAVVRHEKARRSKHNGRHADDEHRDQTLARIPRTEREDEAGRPLLLRDTLLQWAVVT